MVLTFSTLLTLLLILVKNYHIFSGKYNANRTNPMMASKPSRNINSSPTNLSPSRVALRNASGRSSGASGAGSKKGPSSPMSTGTAGRTPVTRRKELSVQPQISPMGSPKNHSQNTISNTNNHISEKTVSKKNSTTSSSRKNSLNGNGNGPSSGSQTTGSARSGTSGSSANRRHNRGRGLSTTKEIIKENLMKREEKWVDSGREVTKFDGLWDVKSVKDGLVRLPIKCLDELITQGGIEKYYSVEDTPVAR